MAEVKKILVVEDNEGLNHLICRKLSKEGFETEGVLSGKAAIRSIENLSPDLMLLDYQMPGMGGKEVIEQLQQKSIKVPFMVVTGNGDERVAVEMMKQGARDYLVKDADFNQILPEKVKQVIRTLSTEKELQESRKLLEMEEERYRLLAENSVDAIWQMDLRMKFTYVSRASEVILGYPPAEMVGKNLWEFARRKDFFQMGRHFLGALKNSKDFSHINFESSMVHKYGSTVPVEITGRLHRDRQDRIVGFQGSTKNISERIRVREQISYQQNLLKTLIDNIPDQIYVKDTDSKYLLNNEGHRRELGVKSQKEMVGRSDNNFFDKDLADEFQADEKRILESGVPIINKEEYKSYPGGNYRWTLTTKVPIHNGSGKIIGLAGINRDITDRKEQEEELIRSRYELALKNRIANTFLLEDPSAVADKILAVFLDEMRSPDGFIGFITSGKSLQLRAISHHLLEIPKEPDDAFLMLTEREWTGAWGEALKKQETVVANNDLKLFESGKEVRNALAVPVRKGKKIFGIITVANKPGGYSPIEVSLLENLSGFIAPVMEAQMHAEEMRQEKEQTFADLVVAKEKAEESDQLKSAFLLNLSHEVRTPLNSIIGFANLLSGKFKDDPQTKQFAEMIDIAGRDLIKMIDDTIDISRLENNDEEFNISNTELIPLLDDLYKDFKGQFKARNPQLQFRFDNAGSRVQVRVDPAKLKKAIAKILDNSGKFTETGKIEMRWERNGEFARVIIEDTGIGIPEELTDAVFEKFRKIVNKDMLYRGNGLGLTIAKGLLGAMNCRISLDSRVGEGTIITMNIPLA